ncbi:MAG: hypothetical protein R3A80_00055 [Bdellovibrionota bacterium]
MASKTKKPTSKSKIAAKPKAKASKKAAPEKKAKPAAKKAKVVKKPQKAKKTTKEPQKEPATEGLKLDPALRKGARTLTKAAPIVALSKILPKEELAASYELADSEVDDFEEDEKAREDFDEVEEDVEGPPEWWKDDPAAIEGADDEDGEGADFDDSDEWTEDDEWADDDKKSSSDNDDDDRDW